MSNGAKALGIVAAVLVLGAVFSGVYGSGWMGFGHHGMSHRGDGSYSEVNGCSNDGDDQCGMMDNQHMMFFEDLDISAEDLARIETIISDANAQIEEILSGYDIEGMRSVSTSGGSCH